MQTLAISSSSSLNNSTIMEQWPRGSPASPTHKAGTPEAHAPVEKKSAKIVYTRFNVRQARKSLGLGGGDDDPPEDNGPSTEEEKRKYMAMKAEQLRMKRELLLKLLGKEAMRRLFQIVARECSDDGMLSPLLVAFLLYASTGDFEYSMDEYHVQEEADYIQAYLVTLGFVQHSSRYTAVLDWVINQTVLEQYTYELVEYFNFQQFVNFLHMLELSANHEIEVMMPRLIQEQEGVTTVLSDSLMETYSIFGTESDHASIQTSVSHLVEQVSAAVQQEEGELSEHLSSHLINVLPFDLRWHFARELRQRLGPDPKSQKNGDE
ncbi:hypothetical protein [Endozoicomonas arenosclerae]|uniref:hypothetical protein n=1 Tax=Endozoicomonas arenosclerae TaxID=1633495 RepID=UPI00155F5BD4|nr:hypothetical protein [Endozoicomonas arenosclerae]